MAGVSSPPPLIPFLPDDLSVLCIARVPVTSHTAIAQVSRSWRSFVRSLSFFSVRSDLAVTELVLTVSTQNSSECWRRFYHLHPFQTPFPLPQLQDLEDQEGDGASVVALGPHLFCIGGHSSPDSVHIYDGRLRRWSHGPPRSTSISIYVAGVAGGRIHIIGRSDPSRTLMAESLEPTSTRWDPVPTIPAHLVGNGWWQTYILDGKLIANWEDAGGRVTGAAFDLDTAEWVRAPPWWDNISIYSELAVVGGVTYAFLDQSQREGILGYGNDGQWRPVEGESVMVLLHRMIEESVSLLTFGDLLCVVGPDREPRDGMNVYIFAGIKISRSAEGGFMGTIMWVDSSSLKLPEKEFLDQCVVMEL